MKFITPLIVMFMSILMIVCTREESIKWGTIIFGLTAVYLLILSKTGTKEAEHADLDAG